MKLMVDRRKLYLPLIGSAISIVIGSILLIGKVPVILTIGSGVSSTILFLIAYLISRGYKMAEYLGLLLTFLEIVSTSLTPAHINSILEFGSSVYVSVIDVFTVLAFYLFPIIYIIYFIVYIVKQNKETS
ncbi:MAG: hypothetical protein RQ872_01120 [Sulfolobaceae archaeon]|nr:hypothetical protein [Sulfolobaceae archaeon]